MQLESDWFSRRFSESSPWSPPRNSGIAAGKCYWEFRDAPQKWTQETCKKGWISRICDLTDHHSDRHADRDQLHFPKTRHKSSLGIAESWGTWLKNSDNHKDSPTWNANFGGFQPASHLASTHVLQRTTEVAMDPCGRTFTTQSLRVQLARPWSDLKIHGRLCSFLGLSEVCCFEILQGLTVVSTPTSS